MSTKSILGSVVVGAVSLTASVALAASHGGGPGGGGSRVSAFSGGAHPGMAPGFARAGSRFGPGMSRNFRDFRGGRDFRHGRFDDFAFFGDFGDPFFYPDPYYYGYYPYGYGYPPYGYGYGYAPYGQSGYGYQGQGAAVGRGSSVAQMQRGLSRAGFYHGRIDGVMGPKTREAMRRSRNPRVTQM